MENNTNWCQSAAGVVMNNGRILLVRHTYGAGTGLLIVPGGYAQYGETPRETVKREVLEETGIIVEPRKLIAMRFNERDWYAVFSSVYISGEARSDNDENSEAVWLDTDEALMREDVSDLSKKLILCALNDKSGLEILPYEGNPKNGKGYLYGTDSHRII